MTDKELKRLSRRELVDIIYELQKKDAERENEIERLQSALSKKELAVSEAGSIAEAALKVNGVFEAAQAAANQYLISLHAANADATEKIETARKQSDELLRQANQRADNIISEAEAKANAIISNANQDAAKSWTQFQQKADELLRTRSELNALVRGDYSFREKVIV